MKAVLKDYSLMTVTLMSLIYISTVILFFNNIDNRTDKVRVEFRETEQITVEDRNENSTPRSFILPATPAIAFEQERADYGKNSTEMDCLYSLSASGYDVGKEGIAGNAKFVSALFKFQKENNLQATGKLNKETMSALHCQP